MVDFGNQEIYIDIIYYPLTTLGPGTRVGVWFQGCSIGCDGCLSKHTWKQTAEKKTNINDLLTKVTIFDTSRLTISGGEPFEQPLALYCFLLEAKKYFNDILVYSGFSIHYLKENFSNILELIDVLVDGPFKKEEPTNKIYKGSANQNMYILNTILFPVYEKYFLRENKELQISKINKNLYVLGIPRIEDSDKILEILKGNV